jgi:hypothetical protein
LTELKLQNRNGTTPAVMQRKEIFTLADPYGFNKTLGKDGFFEAISFRNDCLPEFIKKAMPSNAMIRFSKRT